MQFAAKCKLPAMSKLLDYFYAVFADVCRVISFHLFSTQRTNANSNSLLSGEYLNIFHPVLRKLSEAHP